MSESWQIHSAFPMTSNAGRCAGGEMEAVPDKFVGHLLKISLENYEHDSIFPRQLVG